jgi:DNA-binding CsgD family transcriptional regulator
VKHLKKRMVPGLNPMTTESLSDTIMAIYDSALAPDGWLKALRRIADFSGSAGCRIVVRKNSICTVIYSIEEGTEHHSPRARIELTGVPAPRYPQDIAPTGEPFFRGGMDGRMIFAGSVELWHTEDVRDVRTIVLLYSGDGSLVLEAMKTEQQGPYTETELERLRLISSHVRRAVRISDSLNIGRQTSEILEASLEVLSTGVYFVGPQNRIVYLNRQAREQVKFCSVLHIVEDQLVATDRGSQEQLQAELAKIERNPELEDRLGCALALADGAGSGYVAHILPLRGARQSQIARHFGALAAIFVQDPGLAPCLANAAFARLYGLTDGELRLLNGLMPGLSLAEAARPLGISEATAKTHLRRIFAKTKTSRQAELFYLLMISTPPTIMA